MIEKIIIGILASLFMVGCFYLIEKITDYQDKIIVE